MNFHVLVPLYQRTGERTVSGAPYWSVEFVKHSELEASSFDAAIAAARRKGVVAPVVVEAPAATATAVH